MKSSYDKIYLYRYLNIRLKEQKMKKRLSFRRSVTLTLIFAFVLAFGAIIGVNQGAAAKTGILSIDVTYELGTGPSASDVTMPENASWNPGSTTLAAAPTCKDSDYEFAYWEDAEGNICHPNDPYSVEGTPTKLTFTAVWQVKVTYDVNLDDNDESIATPAVDSACCKVDYKIPDTHTLTGNYYTFLGWSTQADATTAEYKVRDTIKGSDITAPFTLYAVWSPKFYSVIYHANTDSDANDSAVSVPVDATKYMEDNLTVTVMGNSKLASTNANYKTMTDATPTRTGYTFAGWATSATATTAQYQPGATFTISKNTDLYAVWTAGGSTTTTATSTTPQTGSSDQLTLYIVLGALCLLGIAYLCYDQRKAKATK